MSFKLRNMLAGLAVALAGAAQGQTVAPDDEPHSYADVRGWVVQRIFKPSGAFTGCRAFTTSRQNKIMIDRIRGQWRLVTPSFASGVFAGGVLDIDKASIDVQFALRNGWAIRDLTANELNALKKGRELGVTVNGDGQGTLYYALSGSTAAILKVQECADRNGKGAPTGNSGKNTGQNAGQNTGNRTSNFPAMLMPIPTGESRVGDCDAPTAAVYRCTFTGLRAKQGYWHSIRVEDMFGQQMTYDLDVRSRDGADVWVDYGAGWVFLGYWLVANGGRCLEPNRNPSPQVRQARGQDAWGLCLK